jgi:hypothetical protein
MAQLQDKLESLQPYVIGIRYLQGVAVVDAEFNPEWVLPETSAITKHKINDENHYIILSEVKGYGLDELLTYVESTIKLNKDREEKQVLYKSKVNELKKLFTKHSIAELRNCKFTVDQPVESFDEFDDDSINTPSPYVETTIQPIVATTDMAEEDIEILAEERRAEQHFKRQGKNPATTVQRDLNDYGCRCTESEACGICVDRR